MDQRILELFNCKAQRHLKRQLRQARLTTHFDGIIQESTADTYSESNSGQATEILVDDNKASDMTSEEPTQEMVWFSWTTFSQTPVQDLLVLNQSSRFLEYALQGLWNLVDRGLNSNTSLLHPTYVS